MAPRTQKRKSGADDYVSDDGFIANDSDASDRPTKRSKTAIKSSHFATAGKVHVDDDGNQYWEISRMRRVTVSEFKGKQMVSIREYYEKDGKTLPGKKGISMTMEHYSAFVELMPQIEKALTKKGERVPRPVYAGGGTAKEDNSGDDDMKEENEDVEAKKSNIEATSDEDED